MMAKVEKSPPVAALADLKGYLRIEHGAEDALLAGLLRAATETVEAMVGAMLLERDVEERLRVKGGKVALTLCPAVRLVSASLVLDDGSEVPLAAADARFSTNRYGDGHVNLSGVSEGDNIRVRYRSGLAESWNGVPELLRLSVVRTAAHFHAHRDGVDDAGLPPAVTRMASPWRTRRLHRGGFDG